MTERLLTALRIIHSQADLDEEAMEVKSNLIARQTHVIEAHKELIVLRTVSCRNFRTQWYRLLEKQFRPSSNLTVMLFKYMQREMAVIA